MKAMVVLQEDRVGRAGGERCDWSKISRCNAGQPACYYRHLHFHPTRPPAPPPPRLERRDNTVATITTTAVRNNNNNDNNNNTFPRKPFPLKTLLLQ